MTEIDRRQLLRNAAATAVVTGVGAQALAAPAVASEGPAHDVHRSARGKRLGDPKALDGRPTPDFDYTRANKLPREMTGYWEKAFDIGGVTRTAKVYISPETPVRSYYTVIAVPDGVDTAEFLRKSDWRDVADDRDEGLFVLEPGPGGWGDAEAEAAYVEAAMSFYQSNGYFSIFGMHYLVGYAGGAPALEAWAVAHPLFVIAQVYLDSPGLPREYLAAHAGLEFDGETAGFYTDVVFPDGFGLIRYDETVLPTWYINPDRRSVRDSIGYWKQANDTIRRADWDRVFGRVYRQRRESDRWMTSHDGPIATVAVQRRPVSYWNKRTTAQIVDYLTYYTRYENSFAYGNQLVERADYDQLGVEVRTMTVEGFLREYSVYVPRAARRLWGDKAPVVFVWPGNTQTDKVFFEVGQWWKVAQREGFVLVTICEQYNSPISVTHRDSNTFYQQLRDLMLSEYPVDPTRFYSTGHSLGSLVTQNFAIAFPAYFAAVASTSFTAAPDSSGNVRIDGVDYSSSGQPIPNYHIYGYGDLPFISGGLWDDVDNRLDSWAEYHLGVNRLELSDVDDVDGEFSGFRSRFQTWIWRYPGTSVEAVKLTKNIYRSHNNMPDESPLMWDFLKRYRHEVTDDGTIVRYYSTSGFRRPDDQQRLPG